MSRLVFYGVPRMTLTFFVSIVLYRKICCTLKGGNTMRKQVLVVAENRETRYAIRDIILAVADFDPDIVCLTTSHVGAFDMFEEKKPSVVIVCDYTTKGSLAKGFRTYSELKEYAKIWQMVVRVGPEQCDHPDHITYPTHEAPMAKSEESFRTSLGSLIAA